MVYILSRVVITKQYVLHTKNKRVQQVVAQLEDKKSPHVVDEIFQNKLVVGGDAFKIDLLFYKESIILYSFKL